QWENWTYNVIPSLVPVYLKLMQSTCSLRHTSELKLEDPPPCQCHGRKLKVVADTFLVIENHTLRICDCHPTASQLLNAGLFPCSPKRLALAVDVNMLDFTKRFF
ncbi:hypothetical protein C8R43DRAFT_865733, partial [Mycena crocata]